MLARRRFTRHATVLPASYAHVIGDLVSEPMPAQCHTIAAGGCMLVTGDVAELVDAQLVVYLELPSGESVEVAGTIAWATEPRGETPAQVGVRFDAPEALPYALSAYVMALHELSIPQIDDDAPAAQPLDDGLEETEDAPVATGTLAQCALPRLLYDFVKKGFSGTMLLAGGAGGRIELREGIPVDAEHPDVPATWLGLVLVEQGALEQERFDRVVGRQLNLMVSGGESEDSALAALADVSLVDIARARRTLLERTLLRFFDLDDAEFALYAVEPLPAPASELPIDVARLVFEGIRGSYDEARLVRHSNRFAERPSRLRPGKAALVERFEMDDLDRVALERLAAQACRAEDLVAAGVPERQARALLYALYSVEALEIEPTIQVAPQRPVPRAKK